MNKTCIIIAGPTAVGKTDIALALARKYNTEIISADSRQCFKELNIGVAKPPAPALKEIPHHFINSHSINDSISAADFETYASEVTEQLFLKHDITVMVGGTGLYIRAFAEGMDAMPAVDPALRQEIISRYNKSGISWLQQEISIHDPEYTASGEMENPQRLMRALEIVLSSGRSILSFHSGKKKQRNFNIIKIGLELPRETLYERINKRVGDMMDEGLLEEARGLTSFKKLNALQTVGYRELFDHFEGKYSLERAVELIGQNTRHYAKRQLTWFKRDLEMTWIPAQEELVLNYLKPKLSQP